MNSAHRPCVVVFALVRLLPATLLLAGLAFADLSVPSAHAQTPSMASLSPLGVRPGQLQDVVVRGGNLTGATQFWTTFPCQSVLTPQKANNGKNPGEVSFQLTVPADTPLGIYAARVATGTGISGMRLLLVDDLPSVFQKPGNTMPAAAQLVSVPSAIDGTMEPLLRHYYKFHAEAGQRLTMEILARRIGSSMDPVLRLYDASGHEVTYCDDLPGLSEDALIDRTFAKAGDYVIEVGDNLYSGGGNYFYRLRLGDFPGAALPMPLAATRGSEVTFHFADKSGKDLDPVHMKSPADPLLNTLNLPTRFTGGSTRGFTTALLSDGKEVGETEPNNDAKSANRAEFGAGLNGRLDLPGDVDRFVFSAKAGKSLRFTSISHRLGSPADVVLRVLRADGGQIGSAEGTGANEASLTASFAADGDYQLEVRDLNRRGGPRYAYHIDAIPPKADFSLTASTDSLNIPAGGTMTVNVTATRAGYSGPIALSAVGLPPGVTAAKTVIGRGQNGAVFSLRSTAGAATGQVHPVRIIGKAQIANAEFQATADVHDELKTQWGGMPYPPMALATATAIGIGPRPNFALRTEPTEIVFGRNLAATVKVIVERQKGFDEEIALAVASPEKAPAPGQKVNPPLPTGITAAVKPIPKGASSVEITFSADSKAPLSEFTAVLTGSLKKGNATLVEPASGIGLKLEEPFSLSIASAPGKLSRKGQVKLKLSVRRNPAFKAEIAVSLARLPKGLSAAPVKFPAGVAESEIVLSATADAAAGPVKDAIAVGESTVGKSKFSARTPLAQLIVD